MRRAFAAPAFGLYGNAGVGTIRGPGFWDWDTSLSKLFPIHEQIRAHPDAFDEVRFVLFSSADLDTYRAALAVLRDV